MRLCLFSSYFTAPDIPPYVRYWLTELRRHCDRVVLLTNDDKTLDEASLAWLAAQSVELMPVRNEGFDFGMWQKALRRIDTGGCERLVLANDSCILYAPLEDFFTWFEGSALDVGGMLESQAYTRHLQSFLLAFRGQAVVHARDFILSRPVEGMAYDQVVGTFELGLSRSLLAAGFRFGAQFPTRPRHPLDDPSYFFTDELVDAGLPLVKKKLVSRQGPGGAIRRAVDEGRDPAPEAVLARIRERHAIPAERMQAFFGETLARGEAQRRRFDSRVLRYRMTRFLRLGWSWCLGIVGRRAA